MPPLETFEAMVAIFVGRANDDYYRGVRDETIHEFYDTREVYVELPEEETCEDPEPMVGKLLKTMYGTVDASHVWQDDYIGLTSSRGFQKGISIPAVLYHADRQMQAEVHGDGFGVIMKKSQGGWLDEVLSRHDFKVAGLLSSRATSEQSVVYLNRVPVWGPIQWSAYLEADARRVKKVIRDLGLESAKEVTAPAVRLSVSDVPKTDRESQKLDDEKVKTYRSVTMRIMCPSLDRSDIGYGREYAGEAHEGAEGEQNGGLEENRPLLEEVPGRAVAVSTAGAACAATATVPGARPLDVRDREWPCYGDRIC
eukprot:8118718-Pyramimonas_sp.AAC.1